MGAGFSFEKGKGGFFMIGYATVGTNDLPRAVKFYDSLLSVFDAKQMRNDGRIVVWGGGDGAMFAVCTPYDQKQASAGNGVMIALNAGSREKVRQLYDKALELGGTDEGEPGPRGEGDMFYGGYFRDLDGNKFVAFHMGGA